MSAQPKDDFTQKIEEQVDYELPTITTKTAAATAIVVQLAADEPLSVAGQELLQFIERYERLEAEKKDINDAQKEVMAEAKGRGYMTTILRKIVALRRRSQDEIDEEEAVMEMYMAALGMR